MHYIIIYVLIASWNLCNQSYLSLNNSMKQCESGPYINDRLLTDCHLTTDKPQQPVHPLANRVCPAFFPCVTIYIYSIMLVLTPTLFLVCLVIEIPLNYQKGSLLPNLWKRALSDIKLFLKGMLFRPFLSNQTSPVFPEAFFNLSLE